MSMGPCEVEPPHVVGRWAAPGIETGPTRRLVDVLPLSAFSRVLSYDETDRGAPPLRHEPSVGRMERPWLMN